MCIPIALDVPVVGLDGDQLGTAREIICPQQESNEADARPSAPIPIAGPAEQDLWLRVERTDLPDLFVPFSDIAEVRLEGVRLRARPDAAKLEAWERPPEGAAARFESVA